MPPVKPKPGAKSQAKPSTKITIALPDEMLDWCDLMADLRHLERNDIVRQAIALGLIAMQAENVRLAGRPEAVADWLATTGVGSGGMEEYSSGVRGAADDLVKGLRAGIEADLEKASRQA